MTREQAQTDLTAIVSRQKQQFGDAYLKKNGVRLVPIYEEIVGNVRTALWVLLGFRLVLAGLALGVVGALALTRLIRSLMLGVTPNDPLTFVAVSSLLIAITIVAGALPALRATKLDPLKALRSE